MLPNYTMHAKIINLIPKLLSVSVNYDSCDFLVVPYFHLCNMVLSGARIAQVKSERQKQTIWEMVDTSPIPILFPSHVLPSMHVSI